MAIRKPAVIEHLEEHVEDVAMGLFHFVEEDEGIGPAPHRLGQIATCLIADVPRGGTNEPGHGVLLHELGHIDANQRRRGIEEHVRQRLA